MFDEESRKLVVQQDVTFNEIDFGLATHREVKPQNTVDVDINEVNVPEAEHQRPQRHRQPPVRYGLDEYADIATMQDCVHHVAYNACQIMEPKSLEEALTTDHAKQWQAAADSEYESLMKNETWTLVESPSGRKPIGYMWAFKVKYGNDGNVERFKACVVAKGYVQKYGIDYEETISPVVRFSSIRTLLAYAVQNEMLIHQMDVVTAFLNGKLEEEIYMEDMSIQERNTLSASCRNLCMD